MRALDPPRDRQRAADWARTVTADEQVVFLDTETTGLNDTDQIIDLAIVDHSGVVLIDTLVNPGRGIPADASAVHGIFESDVVAAPTWAELFPAIHDVLHHRRVIVYNAQYDKGMVAHACARIGTKAPDAKWECAMLNYARFHGNVNREWRNYRFQRLEKAVGAFGLPEGGHRALGDALACRGVVFAMSEADEVIANPVPQARRLF